MAGEFTPIRENLYSYIDPIVTGVSTPRARMSFALKISEPGDSSTGNAQSEGPITLVLTYK